MSQGSVKLVLKVVSRSAGACALWAAALDHELFDHPVELQAVVEASVCEVHEICDCDRGLFRKKIKMNFTLVGLDGSFQFVVSFLLSSASFNATECAS